MENNTHEMEDKNRSDISNASNAVGEAIGKSIENALTNFLKEIVNKYDHNLISDGGINPKTKKLKKLLMYDIHNNDYNIDGVVITKNDKPIILLEYKYCRYHKHSREKASWVCNTDNSIQKRFTSVRCGIAILAGRWTSASIAMMRSHGIIVFHAPFEKICSVLQVHNIEFDWSEKDKKAKEIGLAKYNSLNECQKQDIAIEIVKDIIPEIELTVAKILDTTIERRIKKVGIELYSNVGERKYLEVNSIDDAVNFLENFTIEEIFNQENAPSFFDKSE